MTCCTGILTVHYSCTLCHYYVNTVKYITYSVNTVQYITVVHYLVRKCCAILTSVDSTDILCSTHISMSLLRKYYSVNTIQYIIVVHCIVHKYCAVLTSVDSNDILYNSVHDALTRGYL
jgi:hypothetical protein